MTTFVGRRSELATLSRTLRTARLVTVTGAGGSGKTRLAAAIFARAADAVWVDLIDIRDASAVAAAVERALGVGGDGTLDSKFLVPAMRDGPRLIVVDNCEHVIAACRDAVSRLLHASSDVRILATSRAALGVAGEVVWRLPPLSLPEESASERLGHGLRADAVRLFVERARSARSDLRLDDAAFAVIGDLCRRLDGLPLAIELAAARTRHMPIVEIASRLGSLRAVGDRDAAVARHQTMTAALDWSYRLIEDRERTLLRRLSVFAGGFTAAGAEAVGGEDVSATVEVLASLVDHSLVEFSAETGRYRLLEPVRQYAEQLLRDAGEDPVAIERAARFVVRLVTETMGLDRGVPRADLLIRPEFPNAAAFMPWLIEHDPAAALRLMTRFALRYRSAVPVHLSVVATWLDRGLASHRVRDLARASALVAWGHMSWSLDRVGAAADAQRGAVTEALGIAEELCDEIASANARLYRAVLTASYESTETALAEYDDLIPTLAHHPRLLALAHSRRAVLRQAMDDADGADKDLRAAFAAWDRIGDGLVSGRAMTMICAAEVLFRAGRVQDAVVQARRAIAAQGANDEPLEAAAFVELAHLAAAAGDHDRALRLVGIADRLMQGVGSWLAPGFLLSDWSWLPPLEDRLGPRSHALRKEGRMMPLDGAVAYAIGERAAMPLTGRELTAANLVADGLTNKEIATRLRISERTAENHVQRARDKLGLRSRAQIARWVAEHLRGATDRVPAGDNPNGLRCQRDRTASARAMSLADGQ